MSAESRQYRARSFGLLWQSDIKLGHFSDTVSGDKSVDVIVRETTALTKRSPIHGINRGFVYTDGFRFEWDDVVTFDIFDGNLIEYCRGPRWTGSLPWPFYSTVAALLLAWRGGIPLHGSAVAIEGQGVLICGVSGAGKSSLVAALTAEGAQFVSDDLSVVVPGKDQIGWQLVSGRPGIRLYPMVAGWFFGGDSQALPNDPRDKVVAVPANHIMTTHVPLNHVIFLGVPGKPMSEIDRFSWLRRNLFRPNWLAKLPRIAAIRVAVRDISASTQICIEPVIGETDEVKLRQRAIAIIDSVRSTVRVGHRS